MATLKFLDLSKLMNDLVHHDSTCTPIPTKFPLDISKFKGDYGKGITNHVMALHIWCSYNSLIDYSILGWDSFDAPFLGPLPNGTYSSQALLIVTSLP